MPDDDRQDSMQETFESIPWERLLADPRERRRKMMAVAGLGLVVLAVASSLARSLWPVGEVERPVVTVADGVSVSVTPPSSPVTTRAPLSEADLMAAGTSLPLASPEGTAEWFLSTYFGSGSAAVDLMPVGLELPVVEPGVASFVDSVHVLETRFEDGSAAVVAVVRILADSGDGYRRPDPLVVEVDLDAVEGGWAVAGPPRPVAWDPPRADQTWGEVPPDVAARATETAGEFGSVVEVGLGRSGEGRWSVVVTIDLGAAGVWPLLVDLPPVDGSGVHD